jgi:hypothetical protein
VGKGGGPFQRSLSRLDVAIAAAARVLLALTPDSWFEDEDCDEDLDFEYFERVLTFDSIVFQSDGSFTIWFAAERVLGSRLIRVEGTPAGDFTEAGI